MHLSAGDLLREERQRKGSAFGDLIDMHIRNGTIVPVEITCKLIENVCYFLFIIIVIATIIIAGNVGSSRRSWLSRRWISQKPRQLGGLAKEHGPQGINYF